MKAELDTSKASFKLDLIETANADPMLSKPDFKLLAAFVAVMTWPSCKTWLTAPLAQAMTGLSERQFRESRLSLQGNNAAKRAYLVPARQAGKVSTFLLVNPWRDEAKLHIAALTDHYKDVVAQKKAKQRTNLSRQTVQGQDQACPGKLCRSVPANCAAYTPLGLPQERKEDREENQERSNVVHLQIKRRTS